MAGPSLQFAIDTSDRRHVLSMAHDAVSAGVDVLEVGTPTMITQGLNIIRDLHSEYPDTKIYADIKLVDHASMLDEVFAAGASFASVMAIASNRNISQSLRVADSFGATIAISTMGYPLDQLLLRVGELLALGATNIIAHGTGESMEAAFRDLQARANLLRRFPNLSLVMAGGINRGNLEGIASFKMAWVIVGRGISLAKSIHDEVVALKQLLSHMSASQKTEHR